MKYSINNTSGKGKAFKVKGGLHVVNAGKKELVECEKELTEGQIENHKANGVYIKKVGESKDAPSKGNK